MKIQDENNLLNLDLSLLAIEAAEELERLRKKLPTTLRNVKALSSLLQKSFAKNAEGAPIDFRFDQVEVFSTAITNSIGVGAPKKRISDIANEAMEIAMLLNSNSINSRENDLNKLITFCVALSDSAALYKEELEELKKHIA
jgi:hypothetical protein